MCTYTVIGDVYMFKNENVVSLFIKSNRYGILKLIIVLVLGCLLGVYVINTLNIDMKNDLINYILNVNDMIVNDNYVIDNIGTFKTLFTNILIYFTLITLLGSTVIFSKLIYLIILHKGFEIGLTISVLIIALGNIKATIYALISMALPSMLTILGIIYISLLWFNYIKQLKKYGDLSSYKSGMYNIIIKTIITFSILIILLIPLQSIINIYICDYIKII